MQKLLFIQSKFDLGGINKVTAIKENYLVNHGYEVHNLNALDDENYKLQEMYDNKIVMHTIALKRLNKLLTVPIIGRVLRFLYYRYKMLQIIYMVNPNMIIVNMPRLEPVIVIWLSFWKRRILEFHGWYNSPSITNLPKQEYAYYILTSPFYKIVTLTKREAAKLKLLTGRCAESIPNPLNTATQHSFSSCDNKRVICMARFSPEKNLESIIPFWKTIENNCPGWELHLYGEGPNESMIRNAIIYNHLNTVHIHPYTNNIEEVLLQSSIYIMPSSNEGFPLALLEAMSAGIPCVAYDCPYGPSEIINNGEDGFVTEYKNPQIMFDKILYLIRYNNVRKEMGRKARENIQRYNLDKIMKQWMDLFNS